MTVEDVRNTLKRLRDEQPRKQIKNMSDFPFSSWLWLRFTERASIKPEKRWADLTEQLVHATYNIQGKTTYKEEFVTYGGIPLKEVNPDTLESNKVPGLHFVDEVLDIDGITGGFNFQAA